MKLKLHILGWTVFAMRLPFDITVSLLKGLKQLISKHVFFNPARGFHFQSFLCGHIWKSNPRLWSFGGVSTNFWTGRLCTIHYPFVHHFDRKKYPFHTHGMEKRYPFLRALHPFSKPLEWSQWAILEELSTKKQVSVMQFLFTSYLNDRFPMLSYTWICNIPKKGTPFWHSLP